MTAALSQPRYWQAVPPPPPEIPATVTPQTIVIPSRAVFDVTFDEDGEITSELFTVEGEPQLVNSGRVLDLTSWAKIAPEPDATVTVEYRATLVTPSGSKIVEGTASNVVVPSWNEVNTLNDQDGDWTTWESALQWLHLTAGAVSLLRIEPNSGGVWQLGPSDSSMYIGNDDRAIQFIGDVLVDGDKENAINNAGLRLDSLNNFTVNGGIWRNFERGAFYLYNSSSNITFRNMQVDSATVRSMHIDTTGSNIEVINCHVHDCDQDGILSTRSNNLQIRQCVVEDNKLFGIHLTGSGFSGRINNTTIWHNTSRNNGDHALKQGQGVLVINGPTNTDVQWNTLEANTGSGVQIEVSTGSAATTDGIIRNNTCRNNNELGSEAGIWIKGLSGLECKSYIVERNHCEGNANGVIVGPHVTDSLVRNNLLVNNNANSVLDTSSPCWGLFTYDNCSRVAMYNNTIVSNGWTDSNQTSSPSTNGSGFFAVGSGSELHFLNNILSEHVLNTAGNNNQVRLQLGTSAFTEFDYNVHWMEPRPDGYANSLSANLTYEDWLSATGFDANSDNDDPQLDAEWQPLIGGVAFETARPQATIVGASAGLTHTLSDANYFAPGDRIAVDDVKHQIASIAGNDITLTSAATFVGGESVFYSDVQYGPNKNRGAVGGGQLAPPPPIALDVYAGYETIFYRTVADLGVQTETFLVDGVQTLDMERNPADGLSYSVRYAAEGSTASTATLQGATWAEPVLQQSVPARPTADTTVVTSPASFATDLAAANAAPAGDVYLLECVDGLYEVGDLLVTKANIQIVAQNQNQAVFSNRDNPTCTFALVGGTTTVYELTSGAASDTCQVFWEDAHGKMRRLPPTFDTSTAWTDATLDSAPNGGWWRSGGTLRVKIPTGQEPDTTSLNFCGQYKNLFTVSGDNFWAEGLLVEHYGGLEAVSRLDSGIKCNSVANATVVDCDFQYNKQIAIWLEDVTGFRVEGCTFRDDLRYRTYSQGRNSGSAHAYSFNGTNGIWMQDSSRGLVRGNYWNQVFRAANFTSCSYIEFHENAFTQFLGNCCAQRGVGHSISFARNYSTQTTWNTLSNEEESPFGPTFHANEVAVESGWPGITAWNGDTYGWATGNRYGGTPAGWSLGYIGQHRCYNLTMDVSGQDPSYNQYYGWESVRQHAVGTDFKNMLIQSRHPTAVTNAIIRAATEGVSAADNNWDGGQYFALENDGQFTFSNPGPGNGTFSETQADLLNNYSITWEPNGGVQDPQLDVDGNAANPRIGVVVPGITDNAFLAASQNAGGIPPYINPVWTYGAFEPLTDFVEVAANGLGTFDVQEWSIAAWVRNVGGTYTTIWSYDFTSHASPFYAQNMHIRDGGQMRLHWNFNNGTTAGTMTANPPELLDNQWHHVAGTYRSGAQRLYVDGVQVASGGAAGTITYYPQPVWIGRMNTGFTQAMQMAESRFYNRELPAAEIAQLASKQDVRSGLLRWFRFDEGSGTAAIDRATGNNGIYSSVSWQEQRFFNPDWETGL